MARGLNKVLLIGNLGADAETRFTPGGASVTNLRVATARSIKDQQSGEYRDETDWHDVVVWNSEKLSQYLVKGTQIFAEGRLQTRSWEDQNGQKRYRTEVVCNSGDITLLGGKDRQQNGDSGPRPQPGRPQPVPQQQSIDDDDVPF